MQAQTLRVEVAAIEQITPHIKQFTLMPVDAAYLPAFSGGSHIIVVIPGPLRTHRNPYSLLGSPHRLDRYEIGVRRMEESRGGSHYLHDRVQVGARLEIAHPVNLFGLEKIARKHVLIAGGVGVTPLLAQLEELHTGSVPFEVHYAIRSAAHAGFGARLRRLAGERLRIYDGSDAQRIDCDQLLADQPLGTHVYTCGPVALIERVAAAARTLGWPDSHIHWERFSAPPVGDAFDVFLARAQLPVHVPPDRSLLESIEAAGVEVPYLCRGGVCGFCRTRVLNADGELLHNDHFLSGAERDRADSIMPCVSRARCKSLVLDL